MNISIATLKIYGSDTNVNVINRLARNTIPKFIIIKTVNGVEGDLTRNRFRELKRSNVADITIEYINLQDVIQTTGPKTFMFFKNFYTTYHTEILDSTVWLDLLMIWAKRAFFPDKPEQQTEDDFDKQTLFREVEFQSVVEGIRSDHVLSKLVDVKALTVVKINEFVAELTIKINKHHLKLQNEQTARDTQQGVMGAEYSNFIPETQQLVVETDYAEKALYHVFDSIELSFTTPFASFNGFYKVLKTTEIRESWVATFADRIVVKMTIGGEIIDVNFYIKDGVVCISSTVESNTQDTGPLISSFQALTPSLKYKINRSYMVELSGVFYIPGQTVEAHVLAHLILIDPAFSNFFIDESSKATKTKSSIYMYFDCGGELIPFVLTPKIRGKYEAASLPVSIKEGDSYIRVKVTKAKAEFFIKELQKTLSKIIALYMQLKDGIIAAYTPFGCVIEEKVQPAVQKDTKPVVISRHIDPNLVPAGIDYARRCDKRPLVLSDNQAQMEEYKKFGITVFPTDQRGIIPRNYVCPYSDIGRTHFGLVEIDKAKNIYLPCCYQKPNNNMREFYGEEVDGGKKKRQQHIMTLGKVLEKSTIGSLDPFPVVKNLVALQKGFTVNRVGMDGGALSFLQCILEAASSEGYRSEDPNTKQTRQEGLRKTFQKLATRRTLVHVLKQSLYDRSIADIRKMIEANDTYIDPTIFKEMFEVKYQCKIIIFNKDGIVLSRTARSFIPREPKTDRVVLILMVGDSCELICHHATHTTEAKYLFDLKQHRCVGPILEIEKAMVRSYVGKKPVTHVSFQQSLAKEKYNLKYQIINSFGKTAAYIVGGEQDTCFVYLKYPCAPSSIQVLENDLRDEKIQIHSDVETNNMVRRFIKLDEDVGVKQVKCKIGEINAALEYQTDTGIVFYVPIKDCFMRQFNKSDNTLVIPHKLDRLSTLERFTRNQKTARYLLEFLFYVFSKYLHSHNITTVETITDKFLDRFAKHRFEVMPVGSTYDINISPLFEANKRVFLSVDNKKLKVTNLEMQKRLIYCLRIAITQRFQEICDYYKRDTIDQFVVDVSDYRQYPQQVLLEGIDAFGNYVNEPFVDHPIHSRLQPGSTKSYMFSNPAFDDVRSPKSRIIYLAKPVCETREAAFKSIQNSMPEETAKKMQLDLIGDYKYANEHMIINIKTGDYPQKIIRYDDSNDATKKWYVPLIQYIKK